MSKYNAKAQSFDGKRFDSVMELDRYMILSQLEHEGKIKLLVTHPKYVLQEAYEWDGKTIRAIVYEADFCFMMNDVFIVEDVKGFRTNEYMLKRRMFLRLFKSLGYIFREISKEDIAHEPSIKNHITGKAHMGKSNPCKGRQKASNGIPSNNKKFKNGKNIFPFI